MGITKKSAVSGKTLLLSSAMPRAQLVEIGGRFNGRELIALWRALRAKLDAHRAAFDALGFTSKWALAMDALVDEIEHAASTTSELSGNAVPTASALNDVIARCKAWRREAATRVAISPKLAARAPKIQTGSSPSALDKTIRALLPLVSSADAAAPGGGAMKAQGQKLLTELSAQLKKHKDATGKLSPAVRVHNEKEGLMYEELKRLARAARGVVPEEAHLFAPSAHARTRMRSRDKAPASPGGASTGSTATA